MLANLFSGNEFLQKWGGVAVLILVVMPLGFVFAAWVRRWGSRRFSPQTGLVAGKIVRFAVIGFITVSIFHLLGLDMTPLLGAAGIVGVALAFASQTSVSNIISGVFLIAEKPFEVGDAITVEGVTGVVTSIDTLSVKLRTPDNRFVRMPNETIIKSQVINITRFPVRRLDILVGVAYREDIGRVREILLDVAARNPLCLMEPKAQVIFQGFGASSVDLLFAVWAAREDFLALKNSIQEEVKARFDQEGVEIPFPHVSVYAGSESTPFPVEFNERPREDKS